MSILEFKLGNARKNARREVGHTNHGGDKVGLTAAVTSVHHNVDDKPALDDTCAQIKKEQCSVSFSNCY